MSEQPDGAQRREGSAVWADAVDAMALLAIDPHGLGGVAVRAGAGPVRDAWLTALTLRLAVGSPVRRVPAATGEARLLGGLDLAATLAAGRPVAERGLLAEADGGVIVLAMAERLAVATTSHICSGLDTGAVHVERDGLTATALARFGVVALDEGIGDDERAPAKLHDRLAFTLDLTVVAPRDMTALLPDVEAMAAARGRLSGVVIGDDILDAITTTAVALGIASVRAALLAVKAARAAAALAGRTIVSEEDAALAARLVLAPRATQIPQSSEDAGDETPAEPPPPDQSARDEKPEAEEAPSPPQDTDSDTAEAPPSPDESALGELLLEAAKAAIPVGLLARLQQAGAALDRSQAQGRVGLEKTAPRGGRPAGVRRGDPRQGGRLDIIATLRAAAPWQMLRRQTVVGVGPHFGSPKRVIEVRKSDFHVKRYKRRSETATIFVVDASGSSALNRLAEAKGAVELLLADCYIRRDQVAVIAFRGKTAELLLAPTRSLVRAKRSLAGLPGGGATPLASALEAAALLADQVRRKGLMPTLIVLTDGRANIARDGTPGREQAQADAVLAARSLRAQQVTTLLIDTSPKQQAYAERLAAEMAAVYLPLPYADAQRLSAVVRATLPGA